MKKTIVLLTIIVALLLPIVSQAEENYNYSGRKTGDAVVVASSGVFRTLLITADGTTACSVILYDNASTATGNIITEFTVSAGTSDTLGVTLPRIYFKNGIYGDMTTTGTCKWEVYYK